MAARQKKQSARRRTGRSQRAPAPAPHDHRLIERSTATVGRLLEGQEFGSIEEANAFLQELLVGGGGKLPDVAPRTPLEQAQELIYQALETTGRRRLELARQALTISADCADAYVLLAEGTDDPHEARRLYEQGVQAGERALGPAVFDEAVGHFWGLLETRPYMRARQGLADVVWFLGERQAAIEHLQELLHLNPGDNQGLRYVLANWLLAVGDDDALERLLAQYPEEVTANWAYTRALTLFRRHGAGKRADRAIEQALETNPFVPLYFLGGKKLPRRLPEYVGLGDEDEAIVYVAEAAENWLETPGALEWLVLALARQISAPLTGKRPPATRR